MANVYERLEKSLIEAIKYMREEIAGLEDPPSYIDFHVEVDGRVLDGDLEIKFIFAGSGYQTTKGGNLTNVVNEYLRRYGWNKKNDAICLPRVDDE